ncbi:AfsR/SARP family transcriptional regulator [Streptomyces olivochromogenes]|uniref:AfsR/SARP family transcriptional regulator n=1 Tax=Streptomyces olivochromogenes TaxID=1963 RepID=UPI0027E48185|nr:AfsR/SARP family transcriptional regulator [Streptomyces olivochromogenes]
MSEIVDVLWGTCPPRSAVNVVRRHVGSLRRLLEPGLSARAAGNWLLREAGGYRLSTDSASSDLLRFTGLVEEARRADAGQEAARSVELLTEALSLWRGPVADGIPAVARAHAAFQALDREHLTAVRDAADAALRAGVPDRVLPDLRKAAAAHPLDEPLLAGLILALTAAGRRPEALRVYEATRARLADELGIDPGPDLHDAHQAALRDAAGTTMLPPWPAPQPPVAPTPAQLPHDIPAFTGRCAELDAVLAPPSEHGPPGGTVVISAIGGMAGVGKTALAVHWAHRVADRFPDGQLYVNLRGFDRAGAIMEPGEAVRGFLDALGVPPERVPSGLDAQSALYRSALAGRRMLVLLDNARDTEHVRPLLPGTPGCLTMVTSRNQLSGLVAAHGARSLTLRPFDPEQARAFLVRRLAPRGSPPNPGPCGRSSGAAPDCRSRWPASPPVPPSTPTSRWRPSPPNCWRPRAPSTPSPGPTPPSTSAP